VPLAALRAARHANSTKSHNKARLFSGLLRFSASFWGGGGGGEEKEKKKIERKENMRG
jgi:hypothetical protein